ncbi:hypothetical protein CSKR_107042 [Clonorchis sinensis]|uniref:Uncharacterized protein n=1 Tax=Clonorchis sinensis TaxID=79923 RepID=A0A3R7JGR7_CLOSI|nr:hypothetical protein CSKR_107042 [Clonorchis sinensis]
MTDATTSFANAIANREFFTWEQFESALAHYMAKNFVVFSRVSSIRSSDELLRFDRASYQCKMHAARADVGEGMGVMHSRLPPCTARFYLRRKKTRLVVTSFNMDHNHPVSKTLYDHLPSTGRINSSDLERRRHSIDYNLPCYDNQDFAGDKEITTMDIRSYRRQSKPIPEHLNPNEWAERLFKLHERRKDRANVPPTLSEPPLLHMVCRVKPLKNTVHYERAILERHGLGESMKNLQWVLVKNTPSVNADLYQVKHLVRIQPVQFPQGLPTALDDLTQCRLRPDGRFLRYRENTVEGHVVTDKGSPQLPTTAVNSDLPEKLFEHSNTGRGYLKRRYLRQWHNRQWSRFSLFQNFFTSHYRYKLNQDGSEYRYSHLWRLDDAMFNAIRKRVNTDGSMKSPNQNRFEANWCTFPWARF